MQNRVRKLTRAIKKKAEWWKDYLSIKYFVERIKLRRFMTLFSVLVLSVLVFVLFFQYAGGVEAIKDHSFDILGVNDNLSFNIQDIVITQISSTLLILTIISFLSGIDEKYVYGEKAVELLFEKKGLLSLKALFFYLVILMLINLCFAIRQMYSLWIIVLFIFSIAILIYISFRFATLYINPESIEKKLQLIYLKENDRHIRRATPLQPNESEKLNSFYNKTIEYIEANDLQYRRNIDVFLLLQNVYLFRYKKKVQEYYTEYISHADFIAYTLDLVNHLFKEGKIEDAFHLADSQFRRLNYHGIVFVVRHGYDNFFSKCFGFVENIREIRELSVVEFRIKNIFQSYLLNLYLATTTDLSYCRLEKVTKEGLYFWSEDRFLSMWYHAVKDNRYLSKREKEEVIFECLLSTIRAFDRYELGIPFNVDDFREQRNPLAIKKQKIDEYIIAQPIVNLYLDLFFDMEEEKFRRALQEGINHYTELYTKYLLRLSFESAFAKDKKEYMFEISVNEEQISVIRKLLNVEDILIAESQFYELYHDLQRYNNKNRNRSGRQTHIYSWTPRLSFPQQIIDDLFAEIARKKHIRWPQ